MDKSYKIIDNVLDKETFIQLKNVFEDSKFPWYFIKDVTEHIKENKLSCYFINMIYRDKRDKEDNFHDYKNWESLDKINFINKK